MKKARQAGASSPFNMYSELLDSGMQASQLFISSAEVIAYRSQMIAQVMNGTLPVTHSEFTRMWQEKMAATMDAYSALVINMFDVGMKYAKNGMVPALNCDLIESQIKTMQDCVRPYQQTATANVKRLRKTIK